MTIQVLKSDRYTVVFHCTECGETFRVVRPLGRDDIQQTADQILARHGDCAKVQQESEL